MEMAVPTGFEPVASAFGGHVTYPTPNDAITQRPTNPYVFNES